MVRQIGVLDKSSLDSSFAGGGVPSTAENDDNWVGMDMGTSRPQKTHAAWYKDHLNNKLNLRNVGLLLLVFFVTSHYMFDTSEAPKEWDFSVAPRNWESDVISNSACVAYESKSHYTIKRDPGKRYEPDPMASHLQERLVSQQLCTRTCGLRDVYVGNNPAKTGSGMGSRFTTLSWALQISLFDDRNMVVKPGNWLYTDPVTCPSQGQECYFNPISSCPAKDEPFVHWRRDHWLSNNLDHVKVDFGVSQKYPRWVPYSYGAGAVDEGSKRTPLWLQSQLMYFLLQPRVEVVEAVEQERARHDWQHPLLAMHVRHGDKGSEAELFPLKEYMDKAEEYRLQHGVSRILIMTEDGGVIEEALKDYSDRFQFFFTDYPRHNANIQADIKHGRLDGEAEAMNALTNLYLAMDCDFFIGTFSSGWSRLVLKMMYATYGYMPPHHSLDAWDMDVTGTPLDEERVFEPYSPP